MGSDLVVALKEASANRTTLFGLNHHAETGQRHAVQIVPGMCHEPGEIAHTSTLRFPQCRHTCAVLGVQSAGAWGFLHGVNEHRVAIGMTGWHSRRVCQACGIGPDLVRLALERSHGAHHAFEVLVDLLEHFGGSGDDNIFLIADPCEAFVLESSGKYWAMLECSSTRAVTDAAMIRQDWRRVAPGLADFALAQGWLQDDGNKLDFVRILGDTGERSLRAQKRWGRASLALAQQQGAIDLYFLRRMLADQEAQNRDLHPKTSGPAVSFLTDLSTHEETNLAWVAFGSLALSLYFPLCLRGDLPGAFGEHPNGPSIEERVRNLEKLTLGKEKDRTKLNAALERLQTKFDHDAEDFLAKAHDYVAHGKPYLVRQIATEMMHDHVEAFDREYRILHGLDLKSPPKPTVPEEVLYFA